MKPFLIFLLMITLFISQSIGRDSLTPTNPLLDNQTLVSAGGTFALGFFTPSNLGNRYVGMWFNRVPDRRIVWVANRENPVVRSTGLLSITPNGTMMITDQRSKKIVWSTGSTTSGLSNLAAQLLDTGNFVVKEDDNNNLRYAWQSFEHPCDTLLEGMKLRMEWATGLAVHLTAWKSSDDPSNGEYYLDIDTGSVDINLRSSSGGKVWRSDGNWDGWNLRSKGLNYGFVNNSEEASFSFQASDKPMIFVLSPTGKIQLLVLSSDSQRWDTTWEEPANQCSMVRHCGPNGICDIESSRVCSCLGGYVPKNPNKWASADWTDGCVREMDFDCRNGTDGFVAVGGAKLPEYPTASADMASNLDECRILCLRDCSCTAYAMDGGYYGCVNWLTNFLSDTVKIQGFDQDLYVRVPSSYLVSPVQPHRRKHKVVAISVSLLLGAFILATASVVCFLRKRRTRRGKIRVTNIRTGISNESTVDLGIPLFDFGTIEAATDSFSCANELGHGGFGTVYKGKLSNGQEIAVKRLAATSLQGADEFKNEVKLIAKLQNVNLVRLVGCCAQGTKERMLIYEYMPNKSLDAFLFDKQKVVLLDWSTRYQIIVGIARGLLYLHHDSIFRIIHRDLKASNILLDNDMNPKISDFGMAKLFGGDETDFNTSKIVGTYGYMSPEYAMEGIFSLKSDVFSFGVLMLEIISGKNNRGANSSSPYLNLVAEAWNLWTRGESFKLVDESVSTTFPEEEVLRCIKVGLLCVQEHPKDRPLMSTVIVMLGADIVSLPEPKMSGFAARIGPVELGSFWNKQARIGLNELDKISNIEDSSVSNELTITLECR